MNKCDKGSRPAVIFLLVEDFSKNSTICSNDSQSQQLIDQIIYPAKKDIILTFQILPKQLRWREVMKHTGWFPVQNSRLDIA